MKLRASHIVTLLLLLCGISIAMAGSPERERKSRHFALAALQRALADDASSAHELYKRAYSIDPDNLAAGYSLALGNLSLMEDDDTIAMRDAFRMMRRYVDAYPADSDEGEYYAYLTSIADNLPEAVRVTRRIYALYPEKTELLPNLAGYHVQLRQLDSALYYYNLYEQQEGFDQQLTMRKVIVHMLKTDTVAALNEAAEGIRVNPLSPDGYLLKGMLMNYIGFTDSVAPYLLKAEQIAPESGQVKIALAQYYGERGDSIQENKYLYESLINEDIELEQKLDLLSAYVAPLIQGNRNTDMVATLLSTLRDQYPHAPEIQDFAAQVSYAKGNYAEASEQIGYAIDMDPANESFRLQQLSYLLADEKYAAAADAFTAIPDSMLSNPSLAYLGAVANSAADRPEKALEVARALLQRLAPGIENVDTLSAADLATLTKAQRRLVSDTYTIIGDTYYKQKDKGATFLAYDNALTATPDNPGTLNNYAYYLAENKGDLDKALEMSLSATMLEPENATYTDTYAWILFRQGRYKEALEQQLKALEYMDKENPSAEYYTHLGDIYFMCGEPDKALEMWKKALPLDPDNELLKRKIKHKTYFYE